IDLRQRTDRTCGWRLRPPTPAVRQELDRNLTSPAQIAIAMQTHGQIDATLGETVPTGTVQLAPSGIGTYVATGAKMTVDPNAIGKLHPDKSGVTTMGHELAHTRDIQAGTSNSGRLRGDGWYRTNCSAE